MTVVTVDLAEQPYEIRVAAGLLSDIAGILHHMRAMAGCWW